MMKNCFRRGYGPRLYMLAGAALWVVLAQPARAVDEIQVYNAGIAAPGQFTIQQHLNYVGIGSKEPPFPGGLGHTMPYLVPDSWPNAFWIATAIAGVVVFFELWAIAYIRARYMDTPFLQAVFQIVLGGAIVLAVGVLIGAA